MAGPRNFDELIAAARADLDDPKRNRIVNDNGSPPRFELFHGGLSICSQKVRVVLAEKGVPYLSHDMVILSGAGIYSEEFRPAENYRPSYVRLRMFAAGPKLMGRLAEKHTYRSSVETEGFDPCVVPLLADLEKKRAVVDSSEICQYIERELHTTRPLMPDNPALALAVLRQVKIVDGIPHPGMLYGFFPNDPRPDFIKATMSDVYDNKVKALEMLIAENSSDADLVRAYRSKISKELAGKKIQRDRKVLSSVMGEFETLIANLDRDLEESGGPWVCGKDFTLADAVWGISLYRIHWLGHAYLWKDHPAVAAYTRRLYQRPSIRDHVIHWPSPMPASPHTADVV